jgi:hypothetical protein
MLKRKKEVYQIACMILLIHGAFVLNGCVSWEPMALDKNLLELDISKESIAIFTLKMSNQYKKSYRPKLETIQTQLTDKKEYYTFQDMKCNYRNEYIISLQLPPGEYEFIHFYGSSRTDWIHGKFYLKLNKSFKLEQNKIVYLGYIDAIIRKKKSADEISAGFALPLIDQAVAGFSDGTFEVNIYDNFDNDIKIIERNYPAIRDYKIEKMILSQ